jgi:hypothetical protein
MDMIGAEGGRVGGGVVEIEIEISTTASGGYRMAIDGPERAWDVVAPLSDRDLAGLPELEPAVRTWDALLGRLELGAPPLPAASWLRAGRLLWERLFTPRLAAAFARAEQQAAHAGAALQCALRVAPGEEPGLLTRLPLELLHDGQRFVLARPEVRLLRAGSEGDTDSMHSDGWLLVAAGQARGARPCGNPSGPGARRRARRPSCWPGPMALARRSSQSRSPTW